MFVQFVVKNFMSFKEETVFDMSAIAAYKEHQYNLIDIGLKEKYLRVASVYGANASGKSNLYLAMRFFQQVIIESLNNVDDHGLNAIERYYTPFSFEDKLQNSEFQIVEILGDYEYRYGYEYNDKCIVSEWLYRKDLKTKRTSTILERTVDKVYLGATVRRECEAYTEQIPTETLALTFFNRLKLKTSVFNELYDGIMDTLVVDTDFYEDAMLLRRYLPDVIDEDKETLLEFLMAIDTGIRDIKYEKKDNDVRFMTTHMGKDERMYDIDMFYESEGTLKCIMVFIYTQVAIYNNRSMFVDELNVKLHPLLLKFIIDLFHNSDSEAQLIYTTHDTTLMDKKFFRRDQIWFVQKDEFGYSHLSALSDFKVRADASFEKDYLAGVYGGIPLIKEFEMKEGE